MCLEAITNEILTPHINIPALMFHDVTDNVTPIEDSRAIAQSLETGAVHRNGRIGSQRRAAIKVNP